MGMYYEYKATETCINFKLFSPWRHYAQIIAKS